MIAHAPFSLRSDGDQTHGTIDNWQIVVTQYKLLDMVVEHNWSNFMLYVGTSVPHSLRPPLLGTCAYGSNLLHSISPELIVTRMNR